MKILMAHNFYKIGGGEDKSYAAEASLLQKNGHEIIRYEVYNKKIQGARKITAALGTVWSIDSQRAISKICREKSVDIAHFQNTFPLLSPSVYFAAKKSGAIVIQSLRNYRLVCANAMLFRNGSICEECLGMFAPINSVKHSCYKDSTIGSAVVTSMIGINRLIKSYENGVDIYVAVSEFLKKKYVESGFDPDRIVVKSNILMSDPGFAKGGKQAVYVGRLSQEKGILSLVKCWIENRIDYPLVVVGTGEMQDELVKISEGSNISIVGEKSTSEVYRIIGESSLLIVPSLWHEPFGRVVIESYALGTPVLVSDKGGLPELILPGETGYIYNVDLKGDLARKINMTLDRIASGHITREKCREYYELNFTPEANYVKMMEIYRKAAVMANGKT